MRSWPWLLLDGRLFTLTPMSLFAHLMRDSESYEGHIVGE